MKLSTQLGVNMLAHETDEEVAVLVDLVAPAVNSSEPRPSASLEVVLDRSGSMADEPIEAAKEALIGLIQRLESGDNFGLVVFGSVAQVVVPAGPLLDKEEAVWLISNIYVGGGADLGAGYLRGLQEINRVAGETGGTLLVRNGAA